MKIDRINLYHLRMPLRSPFETSFGRITTRDCILIEAFSEGIIGYGECVADQTPGYSYETSQTAWHVMADFMVPAMLNRQIITPFDVTSILNFIRGHPMAKAGLEMMVWDLFGKEQGKSLQQMLTEGKDEGKRSVDVGVSIGIQSSAQSLAKVVEGYLGQGYRRVKLKIKPGRDVIEAMAVREAYPWLKLQVDANSAYTLEGAQALLPLDDLELLLIEQPLDEDDLYDHSQLQRIFRTPICLDESILTPRHARQAIEMGACKVINIKVGRVGGLAQALAIHDLCVAEGIPVWCGGMLETGVGRAANLALASLPGFSLPGDISATDRYYDEDITTERFILNPDSTINVPHGPGLGITINSQALQRATLRKS